MYLYILNLPRAPGKPVAVALSEKIHKEKGNQIDGTWLNQHNLEE